MLSRERGDEWTEERGSLWLSWSPPLFGDGARDSEIKSAMTRCISCQSLSISRPFSCSPACCAALLARYGVVFGRYIYRLLLVVVAHPVVVGAPDACERDTCSGSIAKVLTLSCAYKRLHRSTSTRYSSIRSRHESLAHPMPRMSCRGWSRSASLLAILSPSNPRTASRCVCTIAAAVVAARLTRQSI